MDFRIHQLRTFLVTAQSQSFSAAAEKLYISHAALIQQMNALERSLGFTLFERSPKGISLTESGKYFEKKLLEIGEQMENIVNTCIELEKQSTIIRFGNPNDLDVFFFRADLFNSFTMSRRNYSIEYVPTTREQVLDDCQNQKIDIGYYFGPSSRKEAYDLCFTPVSRGGICIIMSPDHPLAQYEKLSVKQLRNRTIYYSDISFSENLYDQLTALRESTLKPFSNSMSELYRITREGELILLPDEYTALYPSLRCLPLDPYADFFFELVYRPNPSPAVQELIDYYTHYVSQSV